MALRRVLPDLRSFALAAHIYLMALEAFAVHHGARNFTPSINILERAERLHLMLSTVLRLGKLTAHIQSIRCDGELHHGARDAPSINILERAERLHLMLSIKFSLNFILNHCLQRALNDLNIRSSGYCRRASCQPPRLRMSWANRRSRHSESS
ncbi:hypothetical protein FB451DRAFT_684855 [Mycena latifolia]|nr:hypothetical protein FB451DRAFT_684855 [Mycena latifolia]